MQALSERIGGSLRSFGQVFANRDLRRLQLAWAGSLIGNWSYFIALAIYAYGQGGAAAVGLVSVIRMLPAAIASPFLAGLADRYPRKLVMVASDVIRAVLMVAAAVTIWQGWSRLDRLRDRGALDGRRERRSARRRRRSCRTSRAIPAELTAANVASSTLEAVGAFVGPALGGVLLALTSIETVFAVNALSFVWSALLVLAVRGVARRAAGAAAEPGGATATATRHRGGLQGARREPRPARPVRALHGADARRRRAERARRRQRARAARRRRRRASAT